VNCDNRSNNKATCSKLHKSHMLINNKLVTFFVIFVKVTAAIINELSQVNHITILLDGWSNKQNIGVLSIRAHFFNKDWVWQNRTLDVLRLSGAHTGELIKNHIWETIKKYNIKDKVSVVFLMSSLLLKLYLMKWTMENTNK
jgi:hypothetical protein